MRRKKPDRVIMNNKSGRMLGENDQEHLHNVRNTFSIRLRGQAKYNQSCNILFGLEPYTSRKQNALWL